MESMYRMTNVCAGGLGVLDCCFIHREETDLFLAIHLFAHMILGKAVFFHRDET